MWNQDILEKALKTAAKYHGEQKVPGYGYPYLFHLSCVAAETMNTLTYENFNNPDLAVQCAVLHDILEDTDCTYEILVNEFGKKVADGVLALTKNNNLPKVQQMNDCLERIICCPPEIWLVKLADRTVNMSAAPPNWTEEKKIRYRKEAEEILKRLRSASKIQSKRLKERIKIYNKIASSP